MESHQKEFLKLKCFSALRILTSPLFKETLRAFLFLPLLHVFLSFSSFSFCQYFFSFFSIPVS
jgi:hypothetical protein